jgi:hypothetical protein
MVERRRKILEKYSHTDTREMYNVKGFDDGV